jgi:guanylate kinase
MQNKLLISITGTSGAGKSTLLMALSDVINSSQIIKQTTSRPPRSDDPPEAFNFLKEEEFKKQEFLVSNNGFGIKEEDYNNFIRSSKTVGLVILGAEEVNQLAHKDLMKHACYAANVLITYSDNEAEETQQLQRGIKEIFNAAQAEKRIISNKDLCRHFFFNPEFTEEHIHIKLNRKETPRDWARKILTALPGLNIQANQLAAALENRIVNNSRKKVPASSESLNSRNKFSM